MYSLLYQYFSARTAIDDACFRRLTNYFVPEICKKKEHLLRPGEVCSFFYFVNSGGIRLYTTNDEGHELTRYFAFEGKFGTALTSFIEQKPSFEYIQCLEKTELLLISRKEFYYLVETVPQMNELYRNILEMAYITSQKRIYGLQGENALERLRWLIGYQPDIFQRVSGKVIASYLGVSSYTLSRLRASL